MDSLPDGPKPNIAPPPPQQPSPPSSDPHPPPDAAAPAAKSVKWRADLTTEVSFTPDDDGAAAGEPPEHNPYVNRSPADTAPSPSSTKKTMESVKNVLSRWGKKVGETAKKAEDLSRNSWQHLKTGPSFAEAAMGRIAQGTKVIAEGGYEKIFKNTFETLPEEQLNKCYACYLSTSAGPVMGILYLSSAKLAFCSDNPLPYSAGDQTEWSYYKVVIPLLQLSAINPSVSKTKSAEKYIQIISVDKHEFWFMGFVNYDGAVKHLQDTFRRIHEPQP